MASTNSALILPAPNPASAGTNSLDIRGIKGPIHIPSSYAWAGWLLLTLAVLIAAWFAWKKFHKNRAAAVPRAVIPPHRRAKDRLRNVNELLSDPYAYCSVISTVVREYLEERFDLHAPDRTTEEFMEEMRSTAALHPDHKELLEEFLSRCDLVKFARFEPSQDELKSLLESALRFIDETAPHDNTTGAPGRTPDLAPSAQ